MILLLSDVREAVQRELSDLSEGVLVNDVLQINTQVLYPSNGLVRVCVRSMSGRLLVSDDSGAINDAKSSGAELGRIVRGLRQIVEPYGLSIDGTAIRSPFIDPRKAAGTIILVANASREASEWLHTHAKIKTGRNFRALLEETLRRKYEGIANHQTKLVGVSNKPHVFSYILKIKNGRQLIIDPVVNDPSSINSRIVAHLDVRSLMNERIEQRIIYDDFEKWEPANLNLLEVGAKVVPFSKLESVIARLTA